MIKRFKENPLIRPDDVKPTYDGWSVEGIYNPGAFKMGDDYCLLARVIEKPIEKDENYISVPMLDFRNGDGQMVVKKFRKDDPDVDWKRDPRFLYYKDETYDVIYSHLRLAKSKDGKNFSIDERPTFASENRMTVYGIHDPRVLYMENEWHIIYSGNSEWGTPTFRATTNDFVNFKQKGIVFPTDNKDVCLFPEKINGKYYAVHRPAAVYFEGYNMWIASSPDLVHWGNHLGLVRIREGRWDSKRVGCAAEPIKTKNGWLLLYHGADGKNYYTGAVLLDLNNPERVLARSKEPFMVPETYYETEGFFDNVIFVNGHIRVSEDLLYIYYGGADKYTAGCEVNISDIIRGME